jgi:hypothetical protein
MKDRPWWTDECKPTLTGREIFADMKYVGGDKHPVMVAEFRSLDHVMDVAESCMPIGSGIEIDGGDWVYGSLGKDETYKALREGRSPSENTRKIYEDLREEVQCRIIQGGFSKARSARRKRVKSWAGGSLNVNRYLESRNSGRITPCFNTMRKRADRQVVRIGINTLMSCGNRQKAWFNLSANAATMCEALEQLGYGVEIVGVSSCRYKMHSGKSRKFSPGGEKCKAYREFTYATMWVLKSYDDPLDIERIMSIGCPGLSRDVTFRVDAMCHGVMYLVGGSQDGSSQCIETRKDVTKELGLDIMMEKTWSESGDERNATRIVGKIKELLGEQ